MPQFEPWLTDSRDRARKQLEKPRTPKREPRLYSVRAQRAIAIADDGRERHMETLRMIMDSDYRDIDDIIIRLVDRFGFKDSVRAA
jgi:hypothetical protein